jgi:hypothetical protein
MQSPFARTFDELLEQMLTDWRNQDNDADLSQASPNFISSACLSSALWGLHQGAAWVADQIFPDSASYEVLLRHANLWQLTPVPGESPARLLDRVLEQIRKPPAGGNRYDYRRWAREASALVASAWCVPCGQGPGTIDLVITADSAQTGSEIPTDELLAAVRAYIVDICPGDVKYLRVVAPEILAQDVTIVRADATFPAATAQASIANYLSGFIPQQKLFAVQLSALSLGGGPGGAQVVDPPADVEPTAYQMIRPGVISVA